MYRFARGVTLEAEFGRCAPFLGDTIYRGVCSARFCRKLQLSGRLMYCKYQQHFSSRPIVESSPDATGAKSEDKIPRKNRSSVAIMGVSAFSGVRAGQRNHQELSSPREQLARVMMRRSERPSHDSLSRTS